MDALEMGLKASANAAKEVVKAFDNGLLGVKKFNFKSSPCTSIEQSERLLALGLKKETSDMMHYAYIYAAGGCPIEKHLLQYHIKVKKDNVWEEISNEHRIPAWSLHRLIEMMPENVTSDDWLGVSFDDVSYYHGEGKDMIGWMYYKAGNLYDCMIECYEWLIKEGYFNEEYLEEN